MPQTSEPHSPKPTEATTSGGVRGTHTSASSNAGASGGTGGDAGGGGGVVDTPTELVSSVQFHSIAEFLNVLSAGELQHGVMHNLRSRIWVTFR